MLGRSLVHALSLRSPHKLGFEDGMDSLGRTATKPEAATATVRSSEMLSLTAVCLAVRKYPESSCRVALKFFFSTFLILDFQFNNGHNYLVHDDSREGLMIIESKVPVSSFSWFFVSGWFVRLFFFFFFPRNS